MFVGIVLFFLKMRQDKECQTNHEDETSSRDVLPRDERCDQIPEHLLHYVPPRDYDG
jgi:hypothetical protein